MTEGYHSMIFTDEIVTYENGTITKSIMADFPNDRPSSYRHTFDDWHLVPSSRPTIQPPPLKEQYIQIPGSNGTKDLTEALTGYPLYDLRTGSIEFWVMPEYEDWSRLYDKIKKYLHGRHRLMVLEDDPMYYYDGRWTVNEWKSEKERSIITLDYKLDPFKYECMPSNGDWLWDPFNFEHGIIREYVHLFTTSNSADWTLNIADFDCPTSPVINALIPAGITLSVQYKNIADQTVTKPLKNGNNTLLDLLITPANHTLTFKSSGTYDLLNAKVSVDFKAGVL